MLAPHWPGPWAAQFPDFGSPFVSPAHQPSNLTLLQLTFLMPTRGHGGRSCLPRGERCVPCGVTRTGPETHPRKTVLPCVGILVCLSSYCCKTHVSKIPNFHHFQECGSVLQTHPVIGPPLPPPASRSLSSSWSQTVPIKHQPPPCSPGTDSSTFCPYGFDDSGDLL